MKTPAGSRSPYLASRLQGLGTTVFAEMSALAERTGSINLGQGFPDRDGPPEVSEAAIAAIRAGRNQYPPGPGHPGAAPGHRRPPAPLLRARVRPRRARSWSPPAPPRPSPPPCWRLCETGDEVVVFEPFYDSYGAAIAMAGAQRRVVPAGAARLVLRPGPAGGRRHAPHPADPAQHARTTRPARSSAAEELEVDRRGAAVDHDLLAVTDEVYEHLIFEGRHVPLCTLAGHGRAHPDGLERGQDVLLHRLEGGLGRAGRRRWWRRCGPSSSSSPTSTARPFQPAVAAGLACPTSTSAGAADGAARTGATGSAPGWPRPASRCSSRTPPTSPIAGVERLGAADGVAFCRDLPDAAGWSPCRRRPSTTIPVEPRPLVRFAFCKQPGGPRRGRPPAAAGCEPPAQPDTQASGLSTARRHGRAAGPLTRSSRVTCLDHVPHADPQRQPHVRQRRGRALVVDRLRPFTPHGRQRAVDGPQDVGQADGGGGRARR